MTAEDGRTFAARLALFYGALFLIYGVHMPFLPVWLDWRGLSPSEIALVTSAPFFLRLAVTPAAGLLADRIEAHRTIVIVCAWGCVLFALALPWTGSFASILVIAVSFHIASSTIMPLTETVAIRGVKAANLDYGRMRLWGSITFVGIGLAGGAILDAAGPAAAAWLLVLGSLATAVAAHLLPRSDGEIGYISSPGAHQSRSATGREAVRLVRTPLFLVFLLGAGIIQGAHGTFYTFGAVHWQEQGLSTSWVGALWAVAILAEVTLFAMSRAVLARMSPADLIAIGGAAAVVRWSVMAFDPPLAVLLPVQLLHALSFGAAHLGAIHFIGRAVPEGAAGTAQALYASAAAGVLIGAVTLWSGPVYEAYGGRAYALPAALAGVGLALALWLRRKWTGGELWGMPPA